jgi:lysophospholipase L1-like esterase
VTFDSPAVIGGAAPVKISCNPESGSTLPLGTTPVNCSASDASSRTATCSFDVRLTGFSIALRKYEAFGDSVTAGETGRPSVAGFNDIDIVNAYPTKLQQQLEDTYPGQGVIVINRGHSLDTVDQTDILVRSFAAADRPDVVLLLLGYNNLTQPCGASGSATQACREAIRKVGTDVRSCIRHAKEADDALKFVFLSTLTPPGASGSNRIDRNAIVQANDQIRQTASSENAVLVDSYSAFLGHEANYVNVDGLHLTPAGYQRLADAFLAAIQATVPQSPSF